MGDRDAREFIEWLRAQLETRKVSQRQLAYRSGVHHSTISRLVSEGRVPTLRTATMLAHGLRGLRAEVEAPGSVGFVGRFVDHPPATRVWEALRADDVLGPGQAHQVLDYYLALRSGKLAIRKPVA
jgi:transcriptional regulator with XRE-family HTH domain